MQRGLTYMRYYLYHPYGKGGSHTTEVLNARLQELNVRRMGRVEITRLIKDGDRVVISIQKTGDITGAVDKKYLNKI